MKRIIQSLLDQPVFIQVEAERMCCFLAWLFSIVAVSSVTGFIPFNLGAFYIPVCGLCLLYILAGGIEKINILYLIMFGFFGISALNSVEPFFNSKIRYLLFLTVMLVCSPFIISKKSILFRALVFRNILVLLIFMSMVSDSMGDEANAYLLKELPSGQDAESEYVMVEDEVEFEAVSGVFSQMLDDDVELEK